MLHFTPTITTAEMRKKPEVIKLMAGINAARAKHIPADKPVDFDYILLCNKICGNSHYNMQMTIVIDSQEDYDKWIKSKKPYYSKAAPEAKPAQVAAK